MKLSEEAKKYAEAIYRKAFHQAAVEGEAARRKIRATATLSNPNISQMSDHFVGMAKRLMTAKIDSYVQAFKQDDLLIDDEDKDEIIEELKQIMRTHIRWVTTDSTIREFRLPNTAQLIPNIESYMTARFEQVLGEAAIDLDFARNEIVMERKNRKPESPSTHYNIHVHGDNFGNIQQGGSGNTQSTGRIPSFYLGLRIRWSQLSNPTEPGTYRISGLGDVNVTADNIKTAKEIGGDPWIDVHDATTLSHSVRQYILGLFTPE